MWENQVNLNQVVEIRVKTTVYFGIGAIDKMGDIAAALRAGNITKTLVVTGKSSHVKTGAWAKVQAALDANGIAATLYSEVTPNPTADQVDQAAKAGRDFGAQAVIAIGGGSPIDAGKSVAILLKYPGKNARDIYEFKFTPTDAAPVIAVNLTHGTGTEADRFAVVSIPEKEYKPAIAYDCIYPLYSIDDPALTAMLPPDQTVYVSVDAVNHVVEAATTKLTNPFAISLAKETVALVAKYLPVARQDPADLTARYFLMYASLLGGVAFDNGLLHFTHALEHPLSGIKPELAHGLGLAILLPAVVKHIYPARAAILAEVLAPLVPGLKGDPAEAEKACDGLRSWLKAIGVKQHLKDEGFVTADVERLTRLAFETPSLDLLLSMAPIEASRDTVKAIYTDSL